MKSVRDVNIAGKTVIIRCDFNVPMQNFEIVDDARIVKALPTIEYCLSQNAKVILMSHLGKVKKKEDLVNTLIPVAKYLSCLLDRNVSFIKDNEDRTVPASIASLKPGDVVLLENTRFADLIKQRESSNDSKLAEFWASLGDIFVFDAFGAAHRDHASTSGIMQFLPTIVGDLVNKELVALSLLESPKKPFIAIMGGAKIDDKILLIKKLLSNVDYLLVGGGIALPFLKAHGYSVDYNNEEHISLCKILLEQFNEKIIIPQDVLVKVDNEYQFVVAKKLNNQAIVDIGPFTNQLFADYISKAKTVLWNGPMGIIEVSESARGTTELLTDLSVTKADVIIGGGDSGVLIKQLGIEDKFYHVSTGGGATLTYIEQGTLPVIEKIKNQVHKI